MAEEGRPADPYAASVNGTQRDPLSEKLPFQRTPDVVVHVPPLQVVWLSSTRTHFICAGRPSMEHDQLPPHQPEAVLASAGVETTRHSATLCTVFPSARPTRSVITSLFVMMSVLSSNRV